MSFTDETTTWENEPTEWNATGVEPTTELKEKGFTAGYKPPADFFNHLFNKIYVSIKELQKKVATRAEIQTELDKKADSEHTHDDYADNFIYGNKSISLGRKIGTEVGNGSIAFGVNVTASQHGGIATGLNTTASGYYSHAEGNGTTASEECSHAEGNGTTASGMCSHAEGENTTASGSKSHAEGELTKAIGTKSHAEGYNTTASGVNSHAEGTNTKAESNSSHAEGFDTIASGNYSHAEGYNTTALDNQHAQGHYNSTTLATANSLTGTSDGTAFVIGNGTNTTKSNAFRITGKGQAIGKASFASSGADYAEYFEWEDGNIENEDRVGYFVTFGNGRYIKKASEGDYILGVVSGLPCVIGNNDECWRKQFEMDEWGRFIYETQTHIDEETGETHEVTFYKVNPEYDSSKEYIHREDRKEWSAIGMFGVLSVYDNGSCQVNGYCKCTNGGIATACERGIDAYRVIERVTDNIIKVVLKP